MSYTGPNPVTQSFVAGSEYFNGDGATTIFTISRQINSTNDILVFFSGVEQNPSTYTIQAGNQVVFNAPPPVGILNIVVRYLTTVLWQSLDVNNLGSGYLYQLQDVASSYAPVLNTSTVSSIIGAPSPGLVFTSITTNFQVGDVISSSIAQFTGQVIKAVTVGPATTTVSINDTTQWGTTASVVNSAVYKWTTPLLNTPLIYDTNPQKWVNAQGQLVFTNSNVGIGKGTLLNVATSNNVAVGNNALAALTTIGANAGANNIAIGNSSGSAIQTSSNNLILGSYTGSSPTLDIRTFGRYGTPAIIQLIVATGTTNAAATTLTLNFSSAPPQILPSSITTASIPASSNLATVLTALQTALLANIVISTNWAVTITSPSITMVQLFPTVVEFPISITFSWALPPSAGLTLTTFVREALPFSTSGNLILSDASANIRALCTSNGQWGFNTTQPIANVHVEGYTRLAQAWEKVNIDTGTLSGTITYGVGNGAVTYYTANPTGNWVWNFTGATGVTPAPFNSISTVGHAMTVALITTQGATPFYNTAIQIDGAAPANFRWQGAVTPSFGNANGFDVYVFTIIKTAPGVYTALGSLTQYGA